MLQWVVRMHLRNGVAITVADLSRDLHHGSGAVTRFVDQLGRATSSSGFAD